MIFSVENLKDFIHTHLKYPLKILQINEFSKTTDKNQHIHKQLHFYVNDNNLKRYRNQFFYNKREKICRKK